MIKSRRSSAATSRGRSVSALLSEDLRAFLVEGFPASNALTNVLPQIRLIPNCLAVDDTGDSGLAVDNRYERKLRPATQQSPQLAAVEPGRVGETARRRSRGRTEAR